jgi:hypothetical protein
MISGNPPLRLVVVLRLVLMLVVLALLVVLMVLVLLVLLVTWLPRSVADGDVTEVGGIVSTSVMMDTMLMELLDGIVTSDVRLSLADASRFEVMGRELAVS